ncbi:methionine ABC transporter ATP-binding protein MetN [Motilimonas sp. E26]|uniref:methionine ABC transporter ATP-binding protein MetN n=1 Tax=Motilimonas sp. E26 TaxID=2865674 RepID=UPI001E2F196D|nr:methionine ABC transporter ATP-binding protein MetN [Motilimonas sp. E26]MCE0557651.1 methionine ABC transporter ATP-binding protein MetN [Motilimonas sp. E26]
MIQLENINKIFGKGEQQVVALNHVNLNIEAGQIFGVIGASGAGKSTLIRCVNLLERPDSGKVIVDDTELTSLNKTELGQARRKIGMIFQHFNLLSSRTVAENIALPLEFERYEGAKIKQRVAELLALVGLTDKANVYPAQLSGGQKQRVAIARALATSPKVLLCDEATSALDPETTKSILNLLKDINHKLQITILMITHEMEVIKTICDQVAIIDRGELIEKNSVADFFSHPKTELAKRFIAATIHIEIPYDYQMRLAPSPQQGSFPLVRLGFSGASVDAPLISELSRKYHVDVSILSANMDYAGGVKFGYMLAELFGESEQTDLAIQFLLEHHISVEVLGYV